MALPRRAFDRVWRSRFARNVAVVASGTAGAQAITMAFAPLITRIYGPEAFGLLGTFMAIVAVAIPVAALAYPIAIVLPREDRDALGLVRLSAILSFGVALLAAALLAFGGDWLTATLGAESVAGYLFLIPVAMLFAAWMQIAQQWLIRKKQFGVVARSAVAHSLILNSAKSGLGWLHPVGAVLIVLATLGHALHAALLFIGARRRYQAEPTAADEGPRTPLKELAHRHRDFPFYQSPQLFLNAASHALPVILLAAYFGPVIAGYYVLCVQVLKAPSSIVGQAVGSVFYPRFSEAVNDGRRATPIWVRATASLGAIGFVPFATVVFLGPWIFEFVFGSDWRHAGIYAQWISAWMFFVFLNQPSAKAIIVYHKQHLALVLNVASTFLRAGAIVLGAWWLESALVAVALYSLTGILHNAIFITMAYWFCANSDARLEENRGSLS
ncbi:MULTISPECIES: lipopolysaccharide biosynthesis protein [unclassified Thioalkalivibrio]|uniref:lipopolysaccharide biosynthesis protein n=1 Tax=unclassified Thioalkalivibrio TaxID=2621013 RepID=UPI000380396E|nr:MULTISPECIES: oligosaccharide flippase family protein [unclassified Thioalkalivibrio]